MKIKKIIKIIGYMFIIMVMSLQYEVKAFSIDSSKSISNVYDSTLPYHYEGEEKVNYNKLDYDGTALYKTNKNIKANIGTLTNVEIYNNDMCRRILENAYPIKTASELGLNSERDAYFATQEAIYVLLEKRDINKYITESDEGEKIIKATRTILEKANETEVALEEITSEWQVYEDDENFKYKEYKIMLSSEIKTANISLENEQSVQIKTKENEEMTNLKNNDIVKIIVPRRMNQNFQVKISYEKDGAIVSQCYNKQYADSKFIVAEKANIRKETIWSIDFQNLAPVTITNYENNTNNTLTGNIFDILDESQQVIKQGLVTNQDGKVETSLEEGKYFIRQTHVADKYSLASNLIGFEITNTQNVDLKVYNSEIVEKETTNEKTEVNITEETEKITENTVTNVTNFHTKNIEKEVVEKTNEINLESINYFVNTIHRKNINNITKENVYNNEAWEETIQSKVLPGVKRFTKFSTEKFIQDMNNIKSDKLEVPNLPIASRK